MLYVVVSYVLVKNHAPRAEGKKAMELREFIHDRFDAPRYRPESWEADESGENPDASHHEVERILLLRSASLELHRTLTGF
jgi:hypothetical protein